MTLSLELEFFNKPLYNSLKKSLYNATPKRKLEIVYFYARDPRIKFSINIEGYSQKTSEPSAKWSTVFNNAQNMRHYLR